MPPLAAWRYDWHAEPGSPEAKLVEHYLRPRDWIGDAP
jgi:coproporphyrinogen III oxidase